MAWSFAVWRKSPRRTCASALRRDSSWRASAAPSPDRLPALRNRVWQSAMNVRKSSRRRSTSVLIWGGSRCSVPFPEDSISPLFGVMVRLLLASAQREQESNDRDDQEHDEQDLGDTRGARGGAAGPGRRGGGREERGRRGGGERAS